MHLSLRPHPQSPADAVSSIEVEAVRSAADALGLNFRLDGEIDRLVIPRPADASRADRLWQHLCFEAFIGQEGSKAYHEINLSPSGQWAAYRFAGYREGMVDAPVASPRIESWKDGRHLLLTASIAGLPAEPWCLGLSAVIEQRDGSKTYWALAHPPGKPDFHHRDCFALRLPPAA